MYTFPIYYFPPVSWFAACMGESNILLEVNIPYRKQRLTTRTWIQTANGALALVIPVGRKHHQLHIRDKQISYQEKWMLAHWRSISFAYKNSPYFEYYQEELQPLFQTEVPLLCDHLCACLHTSFALLGWEVSLSLSPSISPPLPSQFVQSHDLSSHEITQRIGAYPYQQVFDPFLPNLSILDVLFNLGPESGGYLRKIRQAIDAHFH